MAKPIGSISLDLDNKWSYMKTHGDAGWEEFPSFLDLVVPRILDFLQEHSQKITFFVVGQDAAQEKNRAAIASIAQAGHEIGNHSFRHEPWLHLYSPEKLEEEFQRAEEAILDVTGQRPVGFRGPGFSLSDQVLHTLHRRGYEYDCSTFPTYLGPVARMYYMFTAKLSRSEKSDRKQLFGRMSDGFQSLKPFEWNLGDAKLLEIPVTTMPVFKLPIHMTYLTYLSGFSMLAAKMYIWKAAKMCQLFGVVPSFLLHGLDFLGSDDNIGLDYFPGMSIPTAKKLELLSYVLNTFARPFELGCMREHAQQVVSGEIRQRSIQFARSGLG